MGQPINSIFLVRYAGVDPATGDALYFKKMVKQRPIYDPGDRVLQGKLILLTMEVSQIQLM